MITDEMIKKSEENIITIRKMSSYKLTNTYQY